MSDSLRICPETQSAVRDYLGYRTVADVLNDPRGTIVRCTPGRRTTMHRIPGAGRIFVKVRTGRVGDAVAEWRALEVLAGLGITVPGPVFFARSGRSTAVGFAAVAGRPMDALLAEVGVRAAPVAAMASVLRRLHAAGWVFRDMYWNHVFCEAAGGVALIDVERAFRPRWRRRRWIVKDLAGLLASDRDASSRAQRLRFLREYLGGLEGGWRELAREVAKKAAAIRGHVTRYPG